MCSKGRCGDVDFIDLPCGKERTMHATNGFALFVIVCVLHMLTTRFPFTVPIVQRRMMCISQSLQGDARQRHTVRSTRRSVPVMRRSRDRPRSRRQNYLGDQVQNRLYQQRDNVVRVGDWRRKLYAATMGGDTCLDVGVCLQAVRVFPSQ